MNHRRESASESGMKLEAFLKRTRSLILLEKTAEVEKAQEDMQKATEESRCSHGTTLFNLRCSEVEGGLLGRHLITLVRNAAKEDGPVDLPAHKFSSHDIVELRPSKGGLGPVWALGLVFRTRDASIIVALDDIPDGGFDQLCRVDKIANEVTYNRLKDTLDLLDQPNIQQGTFCSNFLEIAFENRKPRFSQHSTIEFFNENLDGAQRQAVERALRATEIAIVHGPPGTGKTTTVIEVIAQEVKRGHRVLACAASNIAVDNIVDRLTRSGHVRQKIVRMGHPARLLPEIIGSCLEAHVAKSDNSSLAKDIQKEIKSLNMKMLKLESWKKAERNKLRKELRVLGKELKQRQEKAVTEVLNNAAVICSTLTGVQGRHIKNMEFDVVVIDEAAQALEVACWGALLKCKKAILAGDHLQLPPTIISEEASKKGLGKTLFERLHKSFGEDISVMLTEQYRMNAVIMQWASDELYDSKLTAHPDVANHILSDLKHVHAELQQSVCLFVDTAGCDCDEIVGENDVSYANPDEGKAVMQHLETLIASGVKPGDIGIITPYTGQVTLLRELRTPSLQNVEISTVDGFQGREKEAILVSTVRSNETEEIGFLNDRRRMNVAVTRARRHCAIFADSATLSSDAFLERLIDYFETNGDYRSYEEFVQCQ